MIGKGWIGTVFETKNVERQTKGKSGAMQDD